MKCFLGVEINISSFNTKNVEDMGGMFNKCDNLNNLNLSSFDTSKVCNMNGMFGECPNLTNKIYHLLILKM